MHTSAHNLESNNMNNENLTPYLKLRIRAESLAEKAHAMKFDIEKFTDIIAVILKANRLADSHDYGAASIELDGAEKMMK